MTHEGLSELKIDRTVSWDVTPCSFGEACCLHHRCGIKAKREVVRYEEKGTEFGRMNEALLFYLEDGSNT
jgi:hypothetical protein